MSITLQVSLLSGKTVLLDTDVDVNLEKLKQQEESALSVVMGRLLHSCGSVLDGDRAIRDIRD